MIWGLSDAVLADSPIIMGLEGPRFDGLESSALEWANAAGGYCYGPFTQYNGRLGVRDVGFCGWGYEARSGVGAIWVGKSGEKCEADV